MDITTPENKYKYWQILREANREFVKKTGSSAPEDFQKWMMDRWGIEVGLESSGYSSWFRVIDEKKYLLFLMSYEGTN
jgi:hypothetical protein